MKRLRFSRRAELDLVGIGDWIAADRPMAARRLVARLISGAEALRATPEMAPLVSHYGEGVRGLSVRPYIILYRVSGEVVFIERVIHGARSPKTIR
ncbi:type II toxin-antitoxin system RelE/ParE family toxin [Caulobacter sp. 602-2]|uniref:Type II toxin-antitoxin system RelE/ParE family toxin n=1 Tax=Caulobacter sp. 602-2 TaxID=2710887 RepID=A0A6G4QVD4_9CAUL|nr:type II toxin-antitoxin system RelE/ParE family toxin [Caulobacter sp. 602-2]NGM49606.1 type II toxin-antitoxin system RelE/ParE family toxin [Caulobacter sp. 602-2]